MDGFDTESLREHEAQWPKHSANDARTPPSELMDPDSDAEVDKAIQQAGGLSTLIMSAVFNDAALPEGFMNRHGQEVTFANRAAGAVSLGNGAGPVDQKSAEEKAKEDQDDAIESIRDAAERNQEFWEWQQQQHAFGGVSLTGEQWGKLADDLEGDTELRRWLVDKIKHDTGKPDAEAQHEADQVALLSRMHSLPESLWTPDMVALNQELDKHPDKKAELTAYATDSAVKKHPDAPRQVVQTSAQADREKSVAARSDLFASAPDATSDFHDAVNAKEPLDAPKPQNSLPAASPVTLAAAAPAMGGLGS